METLYPMGYGTQMVTLAVLKSVHEPHMHPEAARRGFVFLEAMGGKFGIGGGYRRPGTQPNKSGFAPPGKSFHEGQQFPSGLLYVAWDTVIANPGVVHRSPRWAEVPRQGSQAAKDFGVHMNVDTEPWHMQPIELDGYDSWVNRGRPDLQFDYPIRTSVPIPQPTPAPAPTPTPTPVPTPIPQPTGQGITVYFTSRNLTEGASGPDVKFFQRQLNAIASQNLTEDGQYGPMTTQAVKNWQTVFHLAVDGQMGSRTQQSIIEESLKH